MVGAVAVEGMEGRCVAGAAGATAIDGMEGFLSSPMPPQRRALPRTIEAAAQKLRTGDVRAFYETLALLSIRDRPVSVTLARPQDPDCPLIGCSKGFEVLTGFRRAEILGKNCRFLNRGCNIRADTRLRLRMAIRAGDVFSGTLQNRRKDGEVFDNLLYICPLRVGVTIYIVGIQADVTGAVGEDSALDITHAELRRVADSIFSSGIAAWVQLQESNFSAVQLSHAEEGLHLCSQREYARAREAFVAFGYDLTQRRFVYKNTFLEIYNCEDERERRYLGLRRVASEPALAPSQESPRSASRPPMCPSGRSAKASISHLGSCEADDDDEGEDAGNNTNEMGALPAWSAGSAGHPDSCTPCSFHCYSLIGCNRGDECLFCHMQHMRRKHRRRRGRKKRPMDKECGGFGEASGFGDDADDVDGDDGSVAAMHSFTGRESLSRHDGGDGEAAEAPERRRPSHRKDGGHRARRRGFDCDVPGDAVGILTSEGGDTYLSPLPVARSPRQMHMAVVPPGVEASSPSSPLGVSPRLAPTLWLAQERQGSVATTPQHFEPLAPLRSALDVLEMSARLWPWSM